MAEDDEIDVLGDFSLDNILSKNDSAIFDNSALVSQNSDLFNCDYTIHPQWLLDKPSTNPACWYNAPAGLELTDFEQSHSSGPPVVSENSINDESGWTEKEKSLLTRGIEIFGKSYTRLSQFVGSKTPAEVKYFLCNFFSDVQLTYALPSVSEDVLFERNCIQESINAELSVSESETIEDSEIPASIEEVISAVSTAERKVKKPKIGNSYVSKINSNFKQFHNKKNPPKVKFKAAVKLSSASFVKRKQIVGSKMDNTFVTPKPQIHIFTGKNVSVPVCRGEEVIKIQKENLSESGSDIEIDIEDDDTRGCKMISNSITNDVKTQSIHSKPIKYDKSNNVDIKNETTKQPAKLDFSGLSTSLVCLLKSEKYPEKEYLLPENSVTELEQFVFNDFYEGRGTKTPNRYLRIRNHILDAWYHIKPVYVTKTSIRQGLKNCGDVKKLGKIHNFLEQIGAINFGTVQVNYTRPLSEWILSMVQEKPREKSTINPNTVQNNNLEGEKLPYRSRQKKFINDGEGGCTLTHNESGNIIKTTVINEDPIPKQRPQIKKPIVRLIYCRAFPDTRKPQHRVRMSLSALLLMDLHAHMSLTEVMGLVGGHLLNQMVEITRYVPCKNIAPSLTHCDMCPVSQASATDVIHQEDLRVLGWFHSHPTFAPEPSQTDLDTQLSVQQWLGGRNAAAHAWGMEDREPPCLGIILSPFSSQGALIASPYRCMIVEHTARVKGLKEKISPTNVEGSECIPYKFNVDLNTDGFEVDTFLHHAWNLIKSEHNIPAQKRIKFEDTYFQDEKLTYLDKFITSVKMHLAKCSNLSKINCDLLVDGLSDICLNRV